MGSREGGSGIQAVSRQLGKVQTVVWYREGWGLQAVNNRCSKGRQVGSKGKAVPEE